MTRSESMTKTRTGKQRDGQHASGAPQQKKNSTPPALTNRQARTETIRFALYLKLALLMGLGWVSIGFYLWRLSAFFFGPSGTYRTTPSRWLSQSCQIVQITPHKKFQNVHAYLPNICLSEEVFNQFIEKHLSCH